jgi:serine/threonine protein kinase
MQKKIAQEVALVGMFDHPNIVQFVEVIQTPELICIVMEYCDGGDLLSLLEIGNLSTVELKRIFKQIVGGVKYIHGLGFTHGDIKPENVMITRDGTVKLIDFGYSTKKGIGSDEHKSGTLMYAAPELVKRGPFDTGKVDIWALGIILLVMFTGRMPYYDDMDNRVVRQILKGAIVYPQDADPAMKSLVQRITNLIPFSRPSLDDILADAFFDETVTPFGKIANCALSNEIDRLENLDIPIRLSIPTF